MEDDDQHTRTNLDNPPFDPKTALAKLVNSQPDTASRKLPFSDQCAAFYAVYNGVSQHVVAKAFGVTVGTVSKLAGCLDVDPRPTEITVNGDVIRRKNLNQGRDPGRIARYRRVAEQWHAMGEDAFAERYYTDAIHTRLMKVKYDRDSEALRRARQGSDPAADSCTFKYVGAINVNGDLFRIAWVRNAPTPGWYIGKCQTDGSPAFEDGWLWLGRDRRTIDEPNAKPFARSEDADDALWGGREFNPRHK
jgi:hypothetical protein